MRNLIFFFAFVISTFGWARTDARTVFSCSTVNVLDAGYDVRIEGVPRRLEAKVYENSYLGPKLLQSFLVRGRTRRDGIEYFDFLTGGKKFNLLIRDNTALSPGDSHRAFFKAIVNGSVIPPKEFPEFGELSCWEQNND